MATVTKKDLIERIAVKAQCSRVDAKRIVQLFLDEVADDLVNGHRLEFRDFGVLETKDRAARVAQNPKTLERVQVPPKRTVKFKVGRLLKEELDAWSRRELARTSGEPSNSQSTAHSLQPSAEVEVKSTPRAAKGKGSRPRYPKLTLNESRALTPRGVSSNGQAPADHPDRGGVLGRIGPE
jgi:integration host factor subunit beta